MIFRLYKTKGYKDYIGTVVGAKYELSDKGTLLITTSDDITIALIECNEMIETNENNTYMVLVK